MSASELILYSRSAVTTDWKCPRARYWAYEHNNRGLSPAGTHLELLLGTIVHDGLAGLAHDISIDDIIDAGNTQLRTALMVNGDDEEATYFADEQCALIEGLLRGYHKQIWPSFKEMYPEIVAVEQEYLYEHESYTGDMLGFMAKPDLIVRDNEGSLWYVEYKTTSSNKEQWIASWPTAIQLHSSVRAVEASLGEKVTGVIVQGLYKGYASYGKQNSPFCYAYHKPSEPPFTKAVWAYDYRAGLKKYPVWLREGGVKAWVDGMPSELLSQQFPQVPPIFIDDNMVDTFFRQRSVRELDIRKARELINADHEDKQSLLDDLFPQHFEQCQPGWGKGCQFVKLCHGCIDDPLKHGFEPRTSHHIREQEALDAQ